MPSTAGSVRRRGLPAAAGGQRSLPLPLVLPEPLTDALPLAFAALFAALAALTFGALAGFGALLPPPVTWTNSSSVSMRIPDSDAFRWPRTATNNAWQVIPLFGMLSRFKCADPTNLYTFAHI